MLKRSIGNIWPLLRGKKRRIITNELKHFAQNVRYTLVCIDLLGLKKSVIVACLIIFCLMLKIGCPQVSAAGKVLPPLGQCTSEEMADNREDFHSIHKGGLFQKSVGGWRIAKVAVNRGNMQ